MGLKAEIARLKWSLASEKKKQKLLDEACDFLRIWPETNALLEMAKTNGIGIRFDSTLDGTDTDGVFHRNRATGECFIGLRPCLKPDEIAIPLIHELRHFWQEKQLGLTPETGALSETNVQMALVVTRVKEADAFAFTNLMISRINNAMQDFKDAQALERKLLSETNAPQLSPAQQEQVDDFLAARMSARLPAETKKMADDFVRELGDLDSYDRIAIGDYFRRYISPTGPGLKHLTAKDGPVVDISGLRRILHAGSENMPAYMDAQDDKALVETVLSGAKPGIRDVASLIDAFETAARKGAPQETLTKQALDIGNRVHNLTP